MKNRYRIRSYWSYEYSNLDNTEYTSFQSARRAFGGSVVVAEYTGEEGPEWVVYSCRAHWAKDRYGEAPHFAIGRIETLESHPRYSRR